MTWALKDKRVWTDRSERHSGWKTASANAWRTVRARLVGRNEGRKGEGQAEGTRASCCPETHWALHALPTSAG